MPPGACSRSPTAECGCADGPGRAACRSGSSGWLAAGLPLGRALADDSALFPGEVDVGLIAVSRTESGVDGKRGMARALRQDGSA